MIQEVKFQGLAHSPSDYDAQDGELGTCLNLVCEDGALKPIPKPEVTEDGFTLPEGGSMLCVHRVTHDGEQHTHYIFLDGYGVLWWAEKGGDGSKQIIGYIKDINAVTAVGNILCVVGSTKITYAYWKDGLYYIMDFSDIQYSGTITTLDGNKTYDVIERREDVPGSEEIDGGRIYKDTIDATTAQKLFAARDAYLNEKIDDESFKYIQLGVLALRLYDGSHIMVGNPFTIGSTDEAAIGDTLYLWQPIYDGKINNDGYERFSWSGYDTYAIYKRQGLYKYAIKIIFEKIKDYEDIIDGVDVYVSNTIYPYKTNVQLQEKQQAATSDYQNLDKLEVETEKYGTLTLYNGYYLLSSLEVIGKWTLPAMSHEEYDEAISNLSFYKSVSFSADEVANGTAKNLRRVYQTEETISLADSQRTNYGAKVAVTYNNRLHLAGVGVTIGSPWSGIVCPSGQTNLPIVLHAKYKYNGQTQETYNYYGSLSSSEHLVSFPSDNVTLMEVYTYLFLGTGTKFVRKVLDMYDGNSLGISYYTSYKDGKISAIDWATDVSYITEQEWNDLVEKAKSYTPTPSQNQSLIKVSEAENPLVFPAKNSVQVGSSVVNALAANTRPISEGQFGDAPLYAFTDEGVWVLMLGTDGTYMSRQPTNREICSNPDGILQIDDAVLFPTERGIVMQRGRVAECITDQLDGYPFSFPLMDIKGTTAQKVLAVGGIGEISVKYVRLREFLKEANMVYDYYDNRIVLFNPGYAYAYVYSLKSKQWGTMENTLSKRVNIYPESYAINENGQIVDLYVQSPADSVPYFLCSRPMGLGSPEVHKTVFSCIARGYFGSESGKCGMLLFGSNDLRKWYFVSSSVDKYLRGMAGTPYKYFRIALVGSLAPDESISGLSAELQQRWQNKLR